MAQAHRRSPWVSEEDNLLLQLVREQGHDNWVRISQHMHYRSPKQCRERFHQNLNPSLNREPISAEEGLLIEHMVIEMGKRWAKIAHQLGNRSDNDIKNWWYRSMNRKRRGHSSIANTTTPSCTSYSGRIKAPYLRTSNINSSPLSRQLSSISSSYSTVHNFKQPLYIYAQSTNRSFKKVMTLPAFSESSNAIPTVSDNNLVPPSSPHSSPNSGASSQFLFLPVDLHQHCHMWHQTVLSLNSLHGIQATEYQGPKAVDSVPGISPPKSRWVFELPNWRQHIAALTQLWISRGRHTTTKSWDSNPEA